MHRSKAWQSKIFMQLVYSYSLIIIVLVITVESLLIVYYAHDYRKELRQKSELTLSQFKTNVDVNILDDVNNFTINYIGLDRDIRRLFFVNLENNMHLIDNIYTKLLSYVNTRSLYHSIYVYYANNDLVVSNTGSYIIRNDRYANDSIDWLILENFSRSSTWLFMPDFKTHPLINDSNRTDVASYIRRYPFSSTQSSLTGYIAVNINTAEIYQQIEYLSGLITGDFLILNEDGQIIRNTQSSLDHESEKIIIEHIKSNDNSNYVLRLGRDKRWLYWEKSSVNDWIYIYAVTDRLYAERIRMLILMGLILIAITVSVPIILSFSVTRKIYNPITLLIKKSSEINRQLLGNTMGSVFNEDEINTTIDVLMTKVGSLQNQIATFKPEIKAILIRRLIFGKEYSPSEIQDEMEKMDISFPYNLYCCMICRIKTSGPFDVSVLHTVTHNISFFTENIDMRDCVRLSTNMIGDDVVTIVNTTSFEQIIYLVQSIKEYASRLNQNVIIGISDLTESSALHDTYRESISALNYSFIYPDNTIFYAKDFFEKSDSQNTIDESLNRHFERTLNLNSPEQAISVIETIFSKLISDDYSYEIVTDQLKFMHETILFNREFYTPDNINESLPDYMDINNAFEIIKEECISFFDIKMEFQNNKVAQEISQIKEYIKERLSVFDSDAVTLGEVAKHFGKNSNYLSSLFYEQTGINFKDYVIDIKINIAKEELKKPEIRIYEVANKLGYYNVSYFIRVFHHKLGCTPKQYQERFNINN